MFGIFKFDANKARKIRDNRPWYIQYEKWKANRKDLKLNLQIIREQFANGKTQAYLFYLDNEYHATGLLNLFTGVDHVYSDAKWIIQEIEKRGFIVELVTSDTYRIKLPDVK